MLRWKLFVSATSRGEDAIGSPASVQHPKPHQMVYLISAAETEYVLDLFFVLFEYLQSSEIGLYIPESVPKSVEESRP